MYRAALTIACALVLAGCPKPPQKVAKDAGVSDVTLFFTGDMRGEIEPCGCNSNPLGDLSRLAALVEDAGKPRGEGAVAWFDAGSLLFSEPRLSDNKRDQERLKAELLLAQASKLGLRAAGLGTYDLADGKAAVRPRQAANVAPDQGVALEAPKVIDVGGVKVGVFGLADPASLAAYELKASDPLETAGKIVPELRQQGAQVIVALTQLDRSQAKKLADRKLGIDFIVVGRDAPDPAEGAGIGKGIATAGDGYLILPARRGQSVVQVDLHIDGAQAGQPLVDAIGEQRAQDRIAELGADAAKLELKLAEWKKDPTADPKFIADQEAMVEAKKTEIAELTRNPVRKPASGSWLTATHVLIERKLRCDVAVVAAKRAFDKAAAAKNLAAAAGEQPPPVPPEGAGYVGMDEECVNCHKKAVDFWKGTHHAQAWDTLVKVGKEMNRDCISCHVSGWEKPGGATLSKNEHLRNVQCESCHGPGSKHVDANGKEKLSSLVRRPDKGVCLECHKPEHSDTFDYTAYLRDVTGPGHGEAFRKTLGDGPTGFALRKAALDQAAQAIGEGCDR